VDVPLPVVHRWHELQEATTSTAGLAAARGLREALQLWEADLATEAVSAGATWEALGAAMGVSRQAAWERYSRRHGAGLPGHDDVRAVRREQRAALAEARSQARAARRATGDERARLLAEARRQREEALGLLDRKGRQ
jgi:hypothetical protein